MLHFAYGSNMSRALMAARCKGAQALGLATLPGWRFMINAEGFGSIARSPGDRVHGVLWRLTPRDLAAINAYESVDSGLYLRRRLAGLGREKRVLLLGLPDRFVDHGDPARLLASVGLDAEGIRASITRAMAGMSE